MSKTEAHAILDLARAGSLVPLRSINEALSVTGDLSQWHRNEPAQAQAQPETFPEAA